MTTILPRLVACSSSRTVVALPGRSPESFIGITILEVSREPASKMCRVVAEVANSGNVGVELPFDGDYSRLPSVRELGLQWHRIERGVLVDVTPPSEGVALPFTIRPGERVRFDALLPGELSRPGDVLELSWNGLSAAAFTVP